MQLKHLKQFESEEDLLGDLNKLGVSDYQGWYITIRYAFDRDSASKCVAISANNWGDVIKQLTVFGLDEDYLGEDAESLKDWEDIIDSIISYFEIYSDSFECNIWEMTPRRRGENKTLEASLLYPHDCISIGEEMFSDFSTVIKQTPKY